MESLLRTSRLWAWGSVVTAAACAWALALGPVATTRAQATGVIEVSISGFKGNEGRAHITLYGSEDTWLKIPKALQTLQRPIPEGVLKVKFEGLAPGDYAVSVIHDANENDELDMRWFPFPKPKEGAGASRDPKTKMGPPKWKDSKISLAAGEAKHIEIHVAYF